MARFITGVMGYDAAGVESLGRPRARKCALFSILSVSIAFLPISSLLTKRDRNSRKSQKVHAVFIRLSLGLQGSSTPWWLWCIV